MGRCTPRQFVIHAAAAAAVSVHLACGANPTKPAGAGSSSSQSSSAPVRIDVVRDGAGALTVAVGASIQLKAIAVDGAGSQRDVTASATWQSSDPKTAVVSWSGLVKAGQRGTVDISATVDSVSGKAQVGVAEAAELPRNCAAATLSANTASITPFNTVVYVNVITPFSDCRWTAASDASWLNPGDQSIFETGTGSGYDPGRSGDGRITYTASANRTVSPRTGHVRVSFADGNELTYTVEQSAPTCAISVSPGEHRKPYAATSGTFEVTVTPASCRWEAWIDPRISPAWNLSVSGGGTGSGTVSYSVNPTPTNLSSISFSLFARPSNPLDPPIAFRLYLGGNQ